VARTLFSPSWHSVADLRPRLLPQARICRHLYRGQVWYLVQDQTGGRYHRLTPAAYALVLEMDGSRTVRSLWERANTSGLGDACTQTEMVDLLIQLHAADLLQVDATPDSVALFDRYQKKRRATLKQWVLNPMSLKLPLVDPDAFLMRWSPYLAWCFGRVGAAVWLLVVLPAMLLAAQHWQELTNNLSDQVLSSSNLIVMALVYPLVKLLHELGHGFATRVWGGAVHEMGLMFLVFAPVPYVDASSSAAFPSKSQRAIVAAAGMLVELFLAALALYVWLLAEPGVVRAIAFNIMVVAGVSTLVINGNPLLRYDGYYILSDLIEMPNLAQRGQKYLAYLWDRYLFGVHDLEPLRETPAEKPWLLFYTPLAWCYRVFITITIILFVAGEFFIFGVLIALWGLFTLLGMPLWKAYRHVTRSPLLQRRRARAIRISQGILAGILIIAFGAPVPLYTFAQGVVWLPDESLVRAGEGGFFVRWLVQPGEAVRKGTPLLLLEDRALTAEVTVARARVAETEAKYRAEQFLDPVKAALSREQLERERVILRKTEERAGRLLGHAETDGVLIAPQSQDMPGRYFKKGELIAYVLEKQALIARVVVPQGDIDLVRNRYRSAEFRAADWIAQAHVADVVRQAVGGVDELPTAALGIQGGGEIPTLPGDSNGVKTMERVFTVDLALPATPPQSAFGKRALVRFDHGFEPLAWQGMRRLRQLFLSRFGV